MTRLDRIRDYERGLAEDGFCDDRLCKKPATKTVVFADVPPESPLDRLNLCDEHAEEVVRRYTTAEWRKAPSFAEVAEALGVETTRVMAVKNAELPEPLVLYSPYHDEPRRVFAVKLRRGVDGVLFAASEPVELAGFFDRLEAGLATLDEQMRELGDVVRDLGERGELRREEPGDG